MIEQRLRSVSSYCRRGHNSVYTFNEECQLGKTAKCDINLFSEWLLITKNDENILDILIDRKSLIQLTNMNLLARLVIIMDIKLWILLVIGQWFFPGPPVSSTNNTDRYDITERLLQVALNTITLTICFRLLYWGSDALVLHVFWYWSAQYIIKLHYKVTVK